MATLQIHLDDDLKENGLPFRPGNDPFYSLKNQETLRISLDQLQAGDTVTRSLEELRSME